MTKDRRLYAKFDIGMDEHAKIIDLSDAAFRALFESTLYSRRQLTDGYLDERVVLRKWGADVASELSSNDPERPSWVKVDGGYTIHDFGEHQTTTLDIQAKRDAGRKGGIAKAQQKASEVVAPASQPLKQNASTTLAKTETETETKKEKTSPATQDEFDQWYSKYPRKEAKEAARKAFIKARKKASLDELLDGLSRYVVANKDQARNFIALPASWLNAGRWEDELTGVAAGEIDPDAILGRDLWTPPAPPDDLPEREYKAWLVRVRREHEQARYAEAQKRATV